ncbi:hypothetical protein M1D70_31060 [Paenibacillus sp. AK002]
MRFSESKGERCALRMTPLAAVEGVFPYLSDPSPYFRQSCEAGEAAP